MSLDIDEPQVLVQFPGDDIEWHHRVLLRRLHDATWIVPTPDFDIEVADLGEHALLPWVRAALVPAHVGGQLRHVSDPLLYSAKYSHLGFRAQALQFAFLELVLSASCKTGVDRKLCFEKS